MFIHLPQDPPHKCPQIFLRTLLGPLKHLLTSKTIHPRFGEKKKDGSKSLKVDGVITTTVNIIINTTIVITIIITIITIDNNPNFLDQTRSQKASIHVVMSNKQTERDRQNDWRRDKDTNGQTGRQRARQADNQTVR